MSTQDGMAGDELGREGGRCEGGAEAKRRVLVVDDEAGIRELLTQFLRLKGYDVSAAATPDEALHCIESERVDVVLSDVQLAKSDGLALVAEICRRRPELPVVVLTGVILDEDVMRSDGALKIAGYVSKTEPLSQVLRALERALL